MSVHTCHNSRIIAQICIKFDKGGFLFYNLLPTSQPYSGYLSWCIINCKVSNKWGNKEWHNNYCLQESVAMQCSKLLAAFQRNPLPPSSGQMKPEDGGRRCTTTLHGMPYHKRVTFSHHYKNLKSHAYGQTPTHQIKLQPLLPNCSWGHLAQCQNYDKSAYLLY